MKLQKQIMLLATAFLVIGVFQSLPLSAQTQQQSGSVGVEGVIPSDAPKRAPTITNPANGAVFTEVPINVSGLCQSGLLVEVFKNKVFAGAAQCVGGSYSVAIDLFSGRNDLIARQYDALDQASPDSNTVRVTFNDAQPQNGPRISITSEYAKRGANPGDTLTWPITISGGNPPYALSIDWGDKTPLDLLSRSGPGAFTLEHVYFQAGVYNVTIKATDKDGSAAFLQVVGVGNGPIQQTSGTEDKVIVQTKTTVLWWPLLISFALIIVAFWLGKKHQLETIRNRLRRGERPFK